MTEERKYEKVCCLCFTLKGILEDSQLKCHTLKIYMLHNPEACDKFLSIPTVSFLLLQSVQIYCLYIY